MKNLSYFGLIFTLSLSSVTSQTYLDAIRPFWGMEGSSASRATGDIVSVYDQEALLVNPGALSFITRPFIYVDGSFDHIKGRTTLSSTFLQNTYYDSLSENHFRFNEFSLVYPVNVYRGSWVWALGIQPVRMFDRQGQFRFWDSDSSQLVNRRYQLFEEGSLYAASLGTAVLVTKNISLGASLSYLFGSNIYANGYSEEDTDNYYQFARYLDSLNIRADYKGWNLRGGFVAQFPNEILIGGSFESPAILTVEESSQHDVREILDSGIWSLDSSSHKRITYDLSGPWRLGIGTSFKFSQLHFSLGYRYNLYRGTRFTSNLIVSATDSTYIDDGINADIAAKVNSTGEWLGSMRYFAQGGYLQMGFSRQNQPLQAYPGNVFRFDVNLGFTPKTSHEFSLGLQYYTFDAASISIATRIMDQALIIPTTTRHNVIRFIFGFKYYI